MKQPPTDPSLEHIIAVAIRKGDQMWFLYWPCRHCHVLHMLSQTVGDIGEHEQGFLTSYNRFVGRTEAAHLALAAGQILVAKSRLFSEDVW